jgi:hypothetical protein
VLGWELARSVVWNLWPKLDAEEAVRWRMDAAVYCEGRDLPLCGAFESPLLTSLRACLYAIREVQDKGSTSSKVVHVVPTSRYAMTTGHLALTRVLGDVATDPLLGAAETVALMRNRAELVVSYQPHSGNTIESVKWVGVFKPVADLDPIFGQAEPPAHDSWEHLAGLDKRTKSIVNVTLRGIRDGVRDYLAPTEVLTTGEGLSTGAVSAALSGLAGGLTGVTASTTHVPSTPGRRKKTLPRPKVEVRAVDPLERSAHDLATGRQRTMLTVAVVGPDGSWELQMGSLSVAVDGGTMRADDAVRLERWEGGRPTDTGVIVGASDKVRAVVSYPAGMAINFDITVGVA